jgi:hypothetical protein|tara:strand:- start:886 stop:1299 length:414 start_codon:yes stop_codon:yes gene_type:complete
MNKIIYITISLIFLYGCSDEPKVTYEMMGTFIGYEPPSFMKVGNKQIEIPGSKWRIEISGDKLSMIQVSGGQTISYEGGFQVTDKSEISLTIIGSLKDDKYNQNFTPTMIFNKDNGKWFLKGAAGSEGADLGKLIEK